ncbi:MAG: hypothetical protein AAB368_13735 [bacterium]
MRKLAGLAMAVALVAGAGMPSADAAMKSKAPEHQNVLTTNVFNLIITTFGLEYERVLSESGGAWGAFRYGSYDFGSGAKASWPGVSLGYHWYPAKNAPTGFYIGPLLYTQFMNFTFTGLSLATAGATISEDVTGTFIGPMVDLGTRWDWGGFILSPSLQVGYLTGSVKAKTVNVSAPSYGGVAFGLGLNVGAAF